MKLENTILSIDGIDKIILNELIINARTPINQIAVKASISGAAVHQRIKKLEASGLISGSHVKLSPKILGFKTMAFIGVYLDKAMNNSTAVNKLNQIPEILECHYTTGNWSIFIKIMCKDNEHLMNLLNNKIQNIPGISRTETFISLDQQISRQIAL
jgi:Lrp/AsnC family transcriptional regulator for asnA, asnC and gidA